MSALQGTARIGLATTAFLLAVPAVASAQEYPPTLGGGGTTTDTPFEAPAPTQGGALPRTGQEIAFLAAAGVAGVAGGTVLVAAARRRRPVS